MFVATGDDTVGRLEVGPNGTVLTADSATTTGVKWDTVEAGLNDFLLSGMQEVKVGLSPNLSTTTVTGEYVDVQGNPIAGQVKFTPRPVLIDGVANQIIIPRTIIATLDNTGSFSVTLPVTDDDDLSPVNWTYQVEEAFVGGRTYDITIPTGASIDLADVVPAQPATGEGGESFVTLAQYTALQTQVDDIEDTIDLFSAVTDDIDDAATNTAAAAQAAQDLVALTISPLMLLGI